MYKEVNRNGKLPRECPVVVSLSNIAEIQQISPATVKHIKKDEFPYVKLRRLTKIPKAWLSDYFNQNSRRT